MLILITINKWISVAYKSNPNVLHRMSNKIIMHPMRIKSIAMAMINRNKPKQLIIKSQRTIQMPKKPMMPWKLRGLFRARPTTTLFNLLAASMSRTKKIIKYENSNFRMHSNQAYDRYHLMHTIWLRTENNGTESLFAYAFQTEFHFFFNFR